MRKDSTGMWPFQISDLTWTALATAWDTDAMDMCQLAQVARLPLSPRRMVWSVQLPAHPQLQNRMAGSILRFPSSQASTFPPLASKAVIAADRESLEILVSIFNAPLFIEFMVYYNGKPR